MQQVTLEEATAQLAQLIHQARSEGEDILIMEDSNPVAKLSPILQARPRPQFGSAKGLIQIADDFDAPLEDFADYQ